MQYFDVSGPLTDAVRRYKLDSSFLHLPASEVLTLLQEAIAKLRDQTTTLLQEKEDAEEGMTKLKAVLYAKFGSKWTLRRNERSAS